MKIGKRQDAYEHIKKKILEGELSPLSDISEDELQKELEISKTPIRQALQQLNEEGFVYIYPRKGTIVGDISMEMIHWLYETRELLEPHITVKACGMVSDEWLKDVKERFESFGGIGKPTDTSRRGYYIDLDQELHGEILRTCNNRFNKSIMSNVYDHSQWLRVRISMVNREYSSSIEEHVNIINALLEKDSEKIRKAVLDHIHASKESALKYYH